MIRVDLSSDVPVYQQIVDQVRVGIASGQFHPGDRLEPVRDLARRLHINASTVARAYQLLEHDGFIQTNRRGGSAIARDQDVDALRTIRDNRLRGIVERPIVEALAQGYTPEELEAAFGLQLGVWRERRQRGSWPDPAATESLPAPRPEAANMPAANSAQQVHFAGSHDLALEALWTQARQAEPRLGLTVSYVGSLDGLLALLHGEADLVGAHILDEESGEYNLPILRRLFMGHELTVVTLAEREQGLLVAPGNPRGITGLAGLMHPGVRFINRQPGSGTRTLLDYHLRRQGMAPTRITGYNVVATNHMAVAAAVAEGQADAGLGLAAAARAYGLTFVPVARERYDLVLYTEDRRRAPLSALLDGLQRADFRAVVAQMGGYDTTHTGEERNIA